MPCISLFSMTNRGLIIVALGMADAGKSRWNIEARSSNAVKAEAGVARWPTPGIVDGHPLAAAHQ